MFDVAVRFEVRDDTRTHCALLLAVGTTAQRTQLEPGALTWPDVVETTTAVEVMGRYSNPDNVARLHRILSGQGRDRPSHRPVPSLRQKQTRLADSDRIEVLERYVAGEPATVLAKEFGVHRATIFSFLRRDGVPTRYRILNEDDVDVARTMYESGQSLASIGEHFGVPAVWDTS